MWFFNKVSTNKLQKSWEKVEKEVEKKLRKSWNIARGTTDPGYWVRNLNDLFQSKLFEFDFNQKHDLSYRLNTLGPLCLWQCFCFCCSIWRWWMYYLCLASIQCYCNPFISPQVKNSTCFVRPTSRSWQNRPSFYFSSSLLSFWTS